MTTTPSGNFTVTGTNPQRITTTGTQLSSNPQGTFQRTNVGETMDNQVTTERQGILGRVNSNSAHGGLHLRSDVKPVLAYGSNDNGFAK